MTEVSDLAPKQRKVYQAWLKYNGTLTDEEICKRTGVSHGTLHTAKSKMKSAKAEHFAVKTKEKKKYKKKEVADGDQKIMVIVAPLAKLGETVRSLI